MDTCARISAILCTLGVTAAASADVIPVNDHSFEQAAGSLPNPLLNPPLSGQIGGWTLTRGAVGAISGAVVPRMSIGDSALATDGNHIASIVFVAGVNAHAEFRQTVLAEYSPNTCYTLTVDVGTAGVAELLAEPSIRLLAGSDVVASSDGGATLQIVDLNADFSTWTVVFATGAAPPTGAIGIELAAAGTLDLASGVGFDNVRLDAHSLICPADLAPNGVIDISDLALLLSDYGCTGRCSGDLDCDADTDLADLAILLSAFGRACD